MGSKYCNGCKYCKALAHPSYNSENWRCSNSGSVVGGTMRVIAVNVHSEAMVERPMWCPLESDDKDKVDTTPQASWEEKYSHTKTEKEKWNAVNGLVEWDDIEVGKSYHMPPMLKNRRTNFRVDDKTDFSCRCVNLNSNLTFWLYRVDGYFKFLSEIK